VSGISCSHPGCLATLSWVGRFAADPALTSVALQGGWRVLEGAGWTCPAHVKLNSREDSPHVR
jgi:hypothetical protein